MHHTPDRAFGIGALDAADYTDRLPQVARALSSIAHAQGDYFAAAGVEYEQARPPYNDPARLAGWEAKAAMLGPLHIAPASVVVAVRLDAAGQPDFTDDSIASWIVMRHRQLPDGERFVHLSDFFTREPYQGQGLGSLVLKVASQQLEPDTPLYLEVEGNYRRHDKNVAMWRNKGFQLSEAVLPSDLTAAYTIATSTTVMVSNGRAFQNATARNVY